MNLIFSIAIEPDVNNYSSCDAATPAIKLTFQEKIAMELYILTKEIRPIYFSV